MRLLRWLFAPWTRFLEAVTDKRIRARAYELEIRAFRRADTAPPQHFAASTLEGLAALIFAATAIEAFTVMHKRRRNQLVILVPAQSLEIKQIAQAAIPAGNWVDVFETDGFVFLVAEPPIPREEGRA